MFGQPYLGTTEVPDFATLHERERQRLERRKYLNRHVTQPEPFVFHAPSRSKSRQAALPKDPSKDYRWRRAAATPPAPHAPPLGAGVGGGFGCSGRRQGSGVAGRPRSADGAHFSAKTLERAPVVVPPRTTEKTLRAQQATHRALQERRERELREQEEIKQALARGDNSGMRDRVKKAVGVIENLEDKIVRIVWDKQHTSQRVTREKRKDLQQIQDRVNRRPLMMEQTDSLARARRRALLRVRKTLEAAGVKDVASHFDDAELEETEHPDAREGIRR
eukprot:TRINITY_DN22274_c0_g1_i1.p1 TRINITY_DN22274_c0_g1~~TRINITY_DN22274_c0_g1_i1.p1  ORF type:complete len:288 (+),score=71.90 TRINITY_DN22274_c0_g1_i1:35-865(+)